MKRLLSYFIQGLLFLAPIGVTLWIVYIIFNWIDGLLRITIPGVGFVATLVIITFVGFLVSRIFGKGLLHIVDSGFSRVPFIKLVYSSVKDLMGAFTGEKKIFDKPVMVSLLPQADVKVLGFITRDDLSSLGLAGDVAVYVPQAYNFAGNLIIVPKNQVTSIDKPGSEVMAFIVSAGISDPAHKC